MQGHVNMSEFGLNYGIIGRGRFGDRGRFFVSFSRKGDKEPSPVSEPSPAEPSPSKEPSLASILADLYL